MGWKQFPKKTVMHEVGPIGPLTADEEKRFAEICQRFDEQPKRWYEDGLALQELRDRRLYRETHANFEKFVKDRWGWSKPYVSRIIAGTKVAASQTRLAISKTAESCPGAPMITQINTDNLAPHVRTEKHVRAFRRAADEDRPKVVAKLAEKGITRPTAKEVEETVREVRQNALKTIPSVLMAKYKAAIAAANELKRIVGELPETAHLYRNELTAKIDSVHGTLKFAAPHVQCPRCQCKGCGFCSNLGWLSLLTFRGLSKDDAGKCVLLTASEDET